MDTFVVSFFGHREINDIFHAEVRLEGLIRRLLAEKTYVEFMVGRNGDFDRLVSATIRRLKNEYRSDNSTLTLILPYPTSEFHKNEDGFWKYYDEVEICEEAALAHYKSAI